MLDRHVVFNPRAGGLVENEVQSCLAIARALDAKAEPGRVGRGEVLPELRRSKVAWLEISSDTSWLFSRVYSLAYAANEAAGWKFDLLGPHRRLQISKYCETDLGMYDWHIDIGSGSTSARKVSVVVELERAEQGGILQFRPGSNPTSVAQSPGCAVVFPAYLPHRLTPVTRGNRTSLVAWICGPPFR